MWYYYILQKLESNTLWSRILSYPVRICGDACMNGWFLVGACCAKRCDGHQIDQTAGLIEQRSARVTLTHVTATRPRTHVLRSDALTIRLTALLITDYLQLNLLQLVRKTSAK